MRMPLLLWAALFVSGCYGQLEVCGRPPLNTRIAGGQDAPAGSWPWQASLHASFSGFGSFICGGSLINEQWVLSAAHCFNSISAGDLEVYLGRQNQEGSNPNEVKRTVSQIITHPSFNSFTFDNDIALLHLSAPVTFTDYIRAVCLAASGSVVLNGTDSWVTGWGNTAVGVPLPSPKTLKEVEVPVVENTPCHSLYEAVPFTVTDNMMCAGEPAGGRDSCEGDSGGPLVSKQDSVWVQSGIVALEGCKEPNRPGVYTRVSRYESWITSEISTNQPGFVQFTGSPPPVTSSVPPLTTPPSPTMSEAPAPTSTSIPHGRYCVSRPIDNIAFPMVTVIAIVNKPSEYSDLDQLTQLIATKIDSSSKVHHVDPLYQLTKFLQISQSNDSESMLEVEVHQLFLPPANGGLLCFPGNSTVLKALKQALTPPFAQVSFINVTDSLCVAVTFETDIQFEENLRRRTSQEFKTLERRIVRVINDISMTKFGILYKRTVVIGFSPRQTSRRTKRNVVMGTKVELQEEFDPISTSSSTSDSSPQILRSSDVIETLRTAAANTTLGFTIDVASFNITTVTVASRAVACMQSAVMAEGLTLISLLISWTWLAC
ncbi:acrosin-like [Sardina pilchardus]|uniref:acrosin-like n=1 Tax=Sardina pilchardus TaxID=27697 RepID=UPI002E128857